MFRQGLFRCVLGSAASAVLLLQGEPIAAQSVKVSQGADDSTVVSPVVVTALPPVPNVGDGATYFSVDELAQASHDSREAGIDGRDDSVLCHGSARSDFMKPPQSEQRGDFDLEALFDSAGRAQMDVSKKAAAAAAATEAAIATRAALGAGEGSQDAANSAELARQTAVKAYQDALAIAREANFRVNDLEQLAADHVDGNIDDMRALEKGLYYTCRLDKSGKFTACPEDMRQFQTEVNERSYERSQNGGQQVIFVPEEYRDLKLTDIVARQYDDHGTAWLRVTGEIVNPRKQAIATPPLWVSLSDRFGTALADQQLEAQGTHRIPAGGSEPFSYSVKPVPDKLARASVTFAPFHRSSKNLTASAFCSDVIPTTG